MTPPDRKVCTGCRDGAAFEAAFSQPFSMALQPIVSARTLAPWAFEALVRGPQGQGASSVLDAVDAGNRYAFDQACRVRAIELATQLELSATGALLSINFLPNAVYEPAACIRLTLETARRTGFPLDAIIFEFTEAEQVDVEHLGRIIASYRQMGFRTAIDDFGAGYSGLNLLARFHPDIVKLDMELIRGLDADPVKRALVRGVAQACREIGVVVLGEGVETVGESAALDELGVDLQQGYLFARPGFEALPRVSSAASAPAATRAA